MHASLTGDPKLCVMCECEWEWWSVSTRWMCKTLPRLAPNYITTEFFPSHKVFIFTVYFSLLPGFSFLNNAKQQ